MTSSLVCPNIKMFWCPNDYFSNNGKKKEKKNNLKRLLKEISLN